MKISEELKKVIDDIESEEGGNVRPDVIANALPTLYTCLGFIEGAESNEESEEKKKHKAKEEALEMMEYCHEQAQIMLFGFKLEVSQYSIAENKYLLEIAAKYAVAMMVHLNTSMAMAGLASKLPISPPVNFPSPTYPVVQCVSVHDHSDELFEGYAEYEIETRDKFLAGLPESTVYLFLSADGDMRFELSSETLVSGPGIWKGLPTSDTSFWIENIAGDGKKHIAKVKYFYKKTENIVDPVNPCA